MRFIEENPTILFTRNWQNPTTPEMRFADALLHWYALHRRDLPWRRTSDPYCIWVSEIMLQQTRVETVIPYYERFLAKYPDVESLASADEQELLATWAGLGYYSRARNMQRAAQQIVQNGRGFPATLDEIRALPGVGDYTAAAVASIAFGVAAAVLDGNVMRVMARVTNDPGDIRAADTRARLQRAASSRLDANDPGTFNEAVMELGATLCTPADAKCLLCPVESFCEGRRAGNERVLPFKSRAGDRKKTEVQLLMVVRRGRVLMRKRDADDRRLAGFWELPDASALPHACVKECAGEFRHAITNTSYVISVWHASVSGNAPAFTWVSLSEIENLPLSTMARKAFACCKKHVKTLPL